MTSINESIYACGTWIDSQTTARTPVVNPATDREIATVTTGCAADVESAVSAARAAFPAWAELPLAERLRWLEKLHAGISARADHLAATITAEMGAPLGFSRAAQIGLPLRTIRSVSEAISSIVEERLGTSLVCRDPVGVVAAITPWNFPLYQIMAKIAPALAAGCVVVVKPSEVTPLDAIELAQIFHEAGFPRGVFNLVPGGRATGEALVAHPQVDMVSFTGSTRGGRRVAEVAGRTLKRVSLELGGKSANIILADADLDKAILGALQQCFINSGQVCAALSRLLVPRGKIKEIEARALEAARGWIAGDPLDPATRLGPLATRTQQNGVRAHIESAVRDGARLLCGGAKQPPSLSTGAYVAATIFSDVDNDMPIAREEVFGPVLSIIAYDDADDAVRLANDSDYGLSGGVWSTDEAHALSVAQRMHTGQVVLNGASLDLDAPFGGVKCSGHGRENGRYGVEEFLSLKAVLGLAS